MKLNEVMCLSAQVAKDVLVELEKATFVGIDFGTSTTTITRLVYDYQKRQLVSAPLSLAQEDLDGVETFDHLIPTVIAMKGDGHLLFGQGAKSCLLDEEMFAEGYNVWSCFKMRLGENTCYPHTMMSHRNSPVRNYIETPKDAARNFFSYLKRGVEDAVKRDGLPNEIRYAVTVPASFAPNQRDELCSAIHEAGINLNPAALLDEPNSAFMGAIGYYAEIGGSAAFFRSDKPINVLVFDFGAGTCDISLLRAMRDGQIQNIAISHFTALGGRDIDKMIAVESLYPKLIAGREGDDIPVKSVRENVVNKLRPLAERLKMVLCRKYDSDYGERAFARAALSPEDSVEDRFSCPTRGYGVLSHDALSLTSGEFMKIMNRFTSPSRTAFENGDKSVFEPVDEVLRKGGVKKDEVDFVLLVGGSSKNPFVSERLEDYFQMPTQLVRAGDIQTLVARGAAIHSLSVNGFGQSFIAPITSEDVFIKTAGGNVRIFVSGIRVPTVKEEVKGLYVDEDSAKLRHFGIPFYATGAGGERLLGIAKFELPRADMSCDVRLFCSIEADKRLYCSIQIEGETILSESFQMPESLEMADPDEIEFVKAKNVLDLEALCGGGTPTVEQYEKVAKTCAKLDRYEAAAEYYKELMYAHRGQHYEYEIAKCYRDGMNRKEALNWIRRACDYKKSYVNVWYLIWDLAAVKGWDDSETLDWLEYALANWPDDLDFQYVDMQALLNCGQKEEANKRAADLCEAWEMDGVANLSKYTLERFKVVARMCNKGHLVQEINDEIKRLSPEKHKCGERDFGLVSSREIDQKRNGGI